MPDIISKRRVALLPFLGFFAWLFFPPALPASSQEATNENLLFLSSGQRVQVVVEDEKDLSSSYKIDSRGSLYFPLIGPMRVAGLTIEELRQRLEWNLRKYLVDPRVKVFGSASSIQTITVMGRVKNAGNFDYTPGLTLLRVISQAGGFDAAANKRKIRLIRMTEGERRVMTVNCSNIMKGKAGDFEVEPGDLITVPESIF